MPCAGPDYSCNSLLTIRSPLGEIRLDAPASAKPAVRPPGPLIRAWRMWREAIAHWEQRQALANLDQHLLGDIGLSRIEAAREARFRNTASDFIAVRGTRALPRLRAVLRSMLEGFARRRLRFVLREVAPGLIDNIAKFDPQAAHGIRKLLDR